MSLTMFEEMGGQAACLSLAQAWHARVMADPVVSHAFTQGRSHVGRVHGENATLTTSLGDFVDRARTSLGSSPRDGDLVVLDDYFDGVSPIYPTELRILADLDRLGRAHLLVTARDTPHLRSRYDD